MLNRTTWVILAHLLTVQGKSSSEGRMGKSKLTCEISAAQKLFRSDQAVCRLPWITAMEFQSKNFRLGTRVFVHAAYAAHVAVTQPGWPS